MAIFKSKVIVFIILVSLLAIIFVTSYFFNKDSFYNTPNDKHYLHHPTWLFIGDSITRGMFHNDISFVDYFGKSIRCNTINEGHNGFDTLQIINSLDDMNYIVDAVSVCIGTNDWDYDVPIGDTDDTDTDTFCGRINTLMSTLKDKYSKSDIYFCTLIEQKIHPGSSPGEFTPYNNLQLTIEDYSKAITSCAKNNNIEVIDLYKKSGINWKNIDSVTVDGSHPNTKGHKMICNVFTRKFKNPPNPFGI